jgi:RNA ligase (TIGR02306 family)
MTELRKLVTLGVINDIITIPKADRIVGYRVRGWVVVDAKDKYKIGDHVIYIEPDAALPTSVPEFAFLASRSEKTVVNPKNQDVDVHILQTAKLRGQVSQGLLLPIGFGLTEDSTPEEVSDTFENLGVFKYEPPLPAGSAQIASFPTKLARKTDSERVQNLTDDFLQSLDPTEWVATEKIDGTSATFWKLDGVLHAAGRNWELSLEGGHTHAKIARQYNLEELIPEGGVLQGEIFGEGIQGNPIKIQGIKLLVFSHGFVVPTEHSPEVDRFEDWVRENQAPRVPLEFPTTLEQAVEQVDGLKSLVNPQVLTEGVVWWNINGKIFEELGDRPNFKSINAKFLMRHGG